MNMLINNKCKKAATLLIAFTLLLLAPLTLAADLAATADKTSIKAGDVVEVTITLSGKNMSIAEGSFTYDPAVLTYTESDGGASDGLINLVSAAKGGADTLSARIRFTAASAGSAEISASIAKIVTYDGSEHEGTSANVSVTVTAADAGPTPTPIDYAVEGVAALNVTDATDTLYIWRNLENVTIPSRYTETTLEYHGKTVAAVIVEDSDAPMLLYLTNAAGEDGAYYIYDAGKDALYQYRTLSSVSKSYIILEPDGSIELPKGFVEATLTIDDRDFKAWQSLTNESAYLLYARNPDGDTGYFVYNTIDQSFQSYSVIQALPVNPNSPAAGESEKAEETEAVKTAKPNEIVISKALLYVFIGIGALLIIVIIAMLVINSAEKARYKRKAAQLRAEREQMRRHGM